MNFAELRFWGLLGSGLVAILLLRFFFARLRPQSLPLFDRCGLLLLGWSLLLAVGWLTFVIFLAVKVSSFVGLKWILGRARGRRRYLAVLIPWVMAPLFYYKYSRFIGNEVLGLHWDTWRDVVIPVGISFYTFQAVAFLVDTLAFKEPLPRFLDFMNFAGFFPQIVAGPIERRHDLLPQMETFRWRWNAADIDDGVSWITVGLFLKMGLADNLATYFNGTSTTNPFLIWMANLVFGLRIYYDFAGYSLVAIGLARCLGVKLTLNFASPYCSRNIGEFWRRWHITLSQWFRDYVYVPLGGNRTRLWWFNVMLVFVVSGIWHGAGWNFVLWGALNGLYLVLLRLAAPRLRIPGAPAWCLTMLGTFVAWLCFYETRTGVLMQKLQTLLNPAAYHAAALREAKAAYWSPDGFVLFCFLVMSAFTLVLEWRSLKNDGAPFRLLRRPAVLAVLVVVTVALAPAKNNAFIYFAF
jgi:D-alanyl-lipoteichoic acid acyltransferase DltB (MBOAT superfamily)